MSKRIPPGGMSREAAEAWLAEQELKAPRELMLDILQLPPEQLARLVGLFDNDEVRTKRVIVRDGHGRERVVIGTDDDNPFVSLRDVHGTERMRIGLNGDTPNVSGLRPS